MKLVGLVTVGIDALSSSISSLSMVSRPDSAIVAA